LSIACGKHFYALFTLKNRQEVSIMPKYRNNSDYEATVCGVTFPAHGEAVVTFYVPPGAGDFTLTDDAPPVRSPVLLAGEYTDETIALPYSSKGITVSAVGSATLYFADDAAGIDISEGGYAISGQWMYLGKLRIVGTARIVVERSA
jgi:hypothetical protein